MYFKLLNMFYFIFKISSIFFFVNFCNDEFDSVIDLSKGLKRVEHAIRVLFDKINHC